MKRPTQKRESNYKKFKNKLTCLIRVATRNYYNKKIDMVRSNLKQTWKIPNEVINRRIAKAPYPASFSKNGEKINNPVDIANKFCDYFTNMGSNSWGKSRLHIRGLTISCFVLCSDSIPLQPLTVDELSKIVKSFSANKAPGHDNISTKIIHQYMNKYINIV